MKEALKEAKKAYDKNEVPVGVVLVKDGKIVLTTETDYNKLDFETYRGRIHLSGSATLENERKLSNIENNLKKLLGTSVTIKQGRNKKGKIEIEFKDNDEFERIISLFKDE